MNILGSRSEIAAIDKGTVLGSVEQLPKQCEHAWEQTSAIRVPDSYRDLDNIVLCGMGGSGLGARVIESVYANELKIPLVRVNGYDLPGFVNERTLVSCASYSGSTEETLENANQAIAKHAKWMAIGTGKKLLELAKEHGVPFYTIEPTYNPSNQPRMAIGYSVVGQLALVAKTGLIQLSGQQIRELVSVMEKTRDRLNVEREIEENEAKRLALLIKDHVVIFVGAEHLIGALHTVNNQQNENAKNACFDVQIPELNHHLMEGLKYPTTNKENLFFIFVSSPLYPDRIQKRMQITRKVVEKNGILTAEIVVRATTRLAQAFELIQIGAYANFYLAMLYGQNPAPIPWVDWFKEEMEKQ